MKKHIKEFLEQFPDNATCWSQATDDLRDLARLARTVYNEVCLNLTEEEIENGQGLWPLNFRDFTTSAQWNIEGKKYILETYDKMDMAAKRIFYADFLLHFEYLRK